MIGCFRHEICDDWCGAGAGAGGGRVGGAAVEFHVSGVRGGADDRGSWGIRWTAGALSWVCGAGGAAAGVRGAGGWAGGSGDRFASAARVVGSARGVFEDAASGGAARAGDYGDGGACRALAAAGGRRWRTAARASICSSVWAAVTVRRRRDWPRGTVGGRMAVTRNPA